jgi:hypothetical protein
VTHDHSSGSRASRAFFENALRVSCYGAWRQQSYKPSTRRLRFPTTDFTGGTRRPGQTPNEDAYGFSDEAFWNINASELVVG